MVQLLVHTARSHCRWPVKSSQQHPQTVNFRCFALKQTPPTCRTAPRHRPESHSTRRPRPYNVGEVAGESSKNYFPRKSWRDHRTTSDNMLFPAARGGRRLLDDEIAARLLDPRTRPTFVSVHPRSFRSKRLEQPCQTEKFSPRHSA